MILRDSRCLECRNLTLKAFPRMANEGFGKCKLNPQSSQFVSYLYRRECQDYERADEGAVLKRLAWQDQLKLFRRVKS